MGINDNLPPGCSVWDIPGNRPIDAAFDKFLEDLSVEVERCEKIAGLEPADLTDEEIEEAGEVFGEYWDERNDFDRDDPGPAGPPVSTTATMILERRAGL